MNIYTDIENEVDTIRDQIYEKIKDMTADEEIAYFSAAADEARTQYNIRVIPCIPEECPATVAR
jgi:hypothetical protein